MGVEQAPVTDEMMQQMISYVREKVIEGKANIDEDTPLVSSGLIDSFSLIEIFLEVQRIARRKVPANKVQAKDMDTIRLMFATAERFGKPAKN